MPSAPDPLDASGLDRLRPPVWFLVSRGTVGGFGYSDVHVPTADVVEVFTTRQNAIDHAAVMLHPTGIELGEMTDPAKIAELLTAFQKNGFTHVVVDPKGGSTPWTSIGDGIAKLKGLAAGS